MKRALSTFGIALFVVAVAVVPVFAAVKSDDNVVVRKDEVIDDDFFAAGSEVTIEGTINGDVYVGAERLNIRGTVNGDVIAGAATIEVSGTIRDDLRAGGNSISLIGATIGDSVSVGGNELSVDRESTIGGGLIFGGQSLYLSGSVGRGVTTGAENVRLDGPIEKTVRVAATNLVVDQAAVIQGDLEYQSDEDAVIDGEVVGKITQNEGLNQNINTETLFKQIAAGFTVWAFVASIIVGGVLLLLMPKMFRKADTILQDSPYATAGWGALLLIATLPVAVIVMITVFGIPLALLALMFWLVTLYVAKIFVAFSAGSWLLNKALGDKKKDYSPNAFAAVIIGLFLYYGIRLLPYVGGVTRFVVTIVGMGMILLALRSYRKPTPVTDRTN